MTTKLIQYRCTKCGARHKTNASNLPSGRCNSSKNGKHHWVKEKN